MSVFYLYVSENFPAEFVTQASTALSTVKTAVDFHDDFKSLLLNSHLDDKIITGISMKYGIKLSQKNQDMNRSSVEKMQSKEETAELQTPKSNFAEKETNVKLSTSNVLALVTKSANSTSCDFDLNIEDQDSVNSEKNELESVENISPTASSNSSVHSLENAYPLSK